MSDQANQTPAAPIRFHAAVLLGGNTATGIRVPPEVVAALGTSKKPAVTVTLNGYTYRTTVATLDGNFMIPLSAENRQAAGVAAGDEVEVEIALDTQPREVVLPADFAAALEQNQAAGQFFASLSNSNKRRFVMGIEEAKTAETRQRRISKSIDLLKEGKISG